jgi:hypothetical protein
MDDNSGDDDEAPPTDPPESQAQAAEGLSAADYLHLAEECLVLAAVAKDPEQVAELVKASDDYHRRAAKWIADQLKNH